MDEPAPAPPPYFVTGEDQEHVTKNNVHPSSSPLPPPPAPHLLCPDRTCSLSNNEMSPMSPFPAAHTVLAIHPASPLSRFENYETELHRSPGVTTCPMCQVRVTTSIIYRTESYAWLMCLVFVLCGLVLGCCLIPFFVGHFKTVYHTCPHCHRVLHVNRKTCCR